MSSWKNTWRLRNHDGTGSSKRILTGEYVMEGHSQCPWCENHIKIKDDPAGGCHEEVAIFAYFEHSMWEIEADDFLKGRESSKPLRIIAEHTEQDVLFTNSTRRPAHE